MPKVLKVQRVVNPFIRRAASRNPRPKTAPGVKQNPALLVTLGAINPKRRHTVKSKKKNPSKRRASNPTRVIVTAPRKANTQHAPRTVGSAKNPVIFGTSMKPVQLGKALAGSLVGVMLCKLVPPMLPAQLTSNQALQVLVTGAIAFGSGMAAQKADQVFGDGVMYGGLLQTVSVGLNAYLPSLGSRLSLSGTGRRPGGVGYIAPGDFSFPENPIRNALAPAPTAEPVAMSGIRGFKPAFR